MSVSFQGVVRGWSILFALLTVGNANAVTSRALVEVVDFGSPVVSPAGDSVAFRTEQASIERNTYDTVWYVQAMNGESPPVRVADGGVVQRDSAGIPLSADVVWSGDGRWIYYRALFDGRIDVWRAAADGSGAQPLTHDPADIRDFVLGQDGSVLKYSVGATREEVVTAERREYDRGIRIDGTVPIGQGLYRSGNTGGRLATQRYDTTWFDRVSLLGGVPDRWKAVDLATGVRRDLDPSEVPVGREAAADSGDGREDIWRISRSPDGDRVAMLTRIGEQEGLRQKPDVQLSVTSGSRDGGSKICTDELCTRRPITGIQWRPDSEEVLFTVTDPAAGMAQSIYRWDANADVVFRVVRSEGFINGGRDTLSNCGVSSTAMACVTAAPNQPPRLELIDLATGERRVLFTPNEALAHSLEKSTQVRLLRWTAPDGQAVTGQFYAARGNGHVPPPLFVSYYRCTGFVRGGVGDEWPLAVLAQHGISALCINAVPSTIDAVERYGNGMAALESAVGLLSGEGEIDCSRVGMGGLSFGSEVAMWVEMKSSLLAAISVSSTAASPIYYLLASLKGEAFSEILEDLWGLGAPDKTPERWEILSPVFNLDAIGAPILFQMSEQEYLQAVDYAIPLIRDKRADLYVFPNEPHQKFQPRHKLAVYERNLDWFRYWLLGVEDPHPAKVFQYAAWRTMRLNTSPGSACR